MSEQLRTQSLQGLRVLISGGTSGLGRALVEVLSGEGAMVATFARTEREIAVLKRAFPKVTAFPADISRKEDIHRIAALTFEALGGIDVLIQNSSYLGATPLRLLLDTECEDFTTVLEANVLGPFRLAKVILPSMITQKRGLLVHISSDAAINAYSTWGGYSVSKAALDHLSRIWQAELSEYGIRSIAVDPGDMRTPMHFAAVPGANAAHLKDPRVSARQLVERIQSDDFGEGRVRL
jgi:NAD(P)-dependent dehydrogenase (short-subunit alcohol dehydrogenase family)